jgi:hypothetical protein
MKLTLAVAAFAAALCSQGSLAGRWSGTVQAAGSAPAPLYARFKQDAGGISGGFGSDTTKLPPISKVKLNGDSITFDVTWGDVVHIALRQRGDELTGELHADGPPPPPGKHASVIAIVLKRQP